jgi:hypothetical protein
MMHMPMQRSTVCFAMTPDGSAQTIPISLGKASMPALAAALVPLVGSAIQLGAVLRRACRWVFIRMKAINAILSPVITLRDKKA